MIKIILSIVITFIITSILLLIFLILLSTKILNNSDDLTESFGTDPNAPIIADESRLITVYNNPNDSFRETGGTWICPKYIDTITVYCWSGGSSYNYGGKGGFRGNFAKTILSTSKIDKLKLFIGGGGDLASNGATGIKPYGAIKNNGTGGLSGVFLDGVNLLGIDNYPIKSAIPVLITSGGGVNSDSVIPSFISSTIEFGCINKFNCKTDKVIYKDFISKEDRFCIIFEANGYIKPLSRNIVANRVLVVGGGGGGGMDMGGGGGGGGVKIFNNITFNQNVEYNLIIGLGGRGAPAANTQGQPGGHEYAIPSNDGEDSYIKIANGEVYNSIIAGGGGGGGSSYLCHRLTGSGRNGRPNGGSGGGASGYFHPCWRSPQTGGTGMNGGYNGGNKGGRNDNHPHGFVSGGGGGAGEHGLSAARNGGSKGGNGLKINILEKELYWGGGGGGSGYSFEGGSGGYGGGGGGAVGFTLGGVLSYKDNNGKAGCEGPTHAWANCPGGDAGDNTGGGGGGGSHYNANNRGGNGGSGIIILEFTNLAQFTNALSKQAKLEELSYLNWQTKPVYLNPNSITNPSIIDSTNIYGINEDGNNVDGEYGNTGDNETAQKGKNGAIIISISFDEYLKQKKNIAYDEAKDRAQKDRAKKLEDSTNERIESEKLKKSLLERSQGIQNNIDQQEAIKKQKNNEVEAARLRLAELNSECQNLTSDQCRLKRVQNAQAQYDTLLAANRALEQAKIEALNASNLEYEWKKQLKQAIIDARNKEDSRQAGDAAEYAGKNYNNTNEYIYNMINSQYVLYNVLNGLTIPYDTYTTQTNLLSPFNQIDSFNIYSCMSLISTKNIRQSVTIMTVNNNDFQNFIESEIKPKHFEYRGTNSFNNTRGCIIRIILPQALTTFNLRKYVFKVPFKWTSDNKKVMCYSCAIGSWKLFAKNGTGTNYIKIDERHNNKQLKATDYTADYSGRQNIYTSFINNNVTGTISNEFVFVITKLALYNLPNRKDRNDNNTFIPISQIKYEDYEYNDFCVELYGNDFIFDAESANSRGTPINITTSDISFTNENSEW